MIKWAYTTRSIEFNRPIDLEIALDSIGQSGWELISVNMIPTGGTLQRAFCIFKKPF